MPRLGESSAENDSKSWTTGNLRHKGRLELYQEKVRKAIAESEM